MTKHSMIIGVARSGTSILGEILAQHPDVFYSFEPDALWRIDEVETNRRTAADLTLQQKDTILGILAKTIPPYKLYVEKNPWCILRVPYVKAVLPDIKFIHIVRDGRDVACSMLPGGLNHLKTPLWRELAASYTGVELYARMWAEVIETVLLDLRSISHLQVRYEDLVTNPWPVVSSILDYLNLSEDIAVREYCARVSDETAGSYQAAGQVAWYTENHTTRVGRYKENMTPDEITRVTAAVSNTLNKLGYGTG